MAWCQRLKETCLGGGLCPEHSSMLPLLRQKLHARSTAPTPFPPDLCPQVPFFADIPEQPLVPGASCPWLRCCIPLVPGLPAPKEHPIMEPPALGELRSSLAIRRATPQPHRHFCPGFCSTPDSGPLTGGWAELYKSPEPHFPSSSLQPELLLGLERRPQPFSPGGQVEAPSPGVSINLPAPPPASPSGPDAASREAAPG